MEKDCVSLFWLPYQPGHPSTRHSQPYSSPYEDELTKNMGRKNAQRVLEREKAHWASPGCLQHLGVGANRDMQQCLKVLKPVLPLGFALGVVTRSFWGHEQLGDGKREWEGGRKRKQKWKRESEEEQEIGNRKRSPHTSLPKNGWALVRLLKILF